VPHAPRILAPVSPVHGAEAKRRLADLLAELSRRARPVRVVPKRRFWHQRAADIALRIVTLGGQRAYLSSYVTTLGHTIYVPDDFDDWAPGRAWEVLRHEAVHVRQFERIGWVGMVLLYGVLPLPLGLAWFRARLEMEAYTETLRAVADLEGMEAARSPRLHAEIIRRFTGPDYGWMWPFPKAVQRWIDAALATIEAERLAGGE
jgi:hypothetical protein